MKKNTILIISSILLLGMISFFGVISCKKITSPTDNLKLIVDYNVIKTTIDVHLYDVTTGQLIPNPTKDKGLIIITGQDKSAVIDMMGIAPENKSIAIDRGVASMALHPKDAPSQSKMISFNIVAKMPGYLTTTKQVNLTEIGRNFVRVNMIPLDTPPEGVSVGRVSGAATAQNGRVSAPATIELPNGRSSLHIPEGILLKDTAGNNLSGSLDVKIIHFDNISQDALSAFPGGLTPTVERTSGATESGMFYSAGFIAIEITDPNGRQASSLEDGKMELISRVSPQTYNPNTQTSIKAGDIIPFWSLDENTGSWKEEGTATAIEKNGFLQFEKQLNHLSYYNFDWFLGGTCISGRPFVFNTTPPVTGSFLMKGNIFRQSDNTFINTILMWVDGNEPVYTANAPQGVPVRIEWDTENSDFISVAPNSQPTYVDDLCGQSPINVDLISSSSSEFTTISVQISLKCASQPDVVIYPPDLTLYCQSMNGGDIITFGLTSGKASIPGIKLGDTYEVWFSYDGIDYNHQIVVTQNSYSLIDFEIPADVCTDVFGY
jgi:hypothetical protein